MYVIVTSKPGVYESALENNSEVLESYKYMFYGRCHAIFHLAKLNDEGYVRITEDEPPHISNRVPTKFLEHFDTLEQARSEIDNLTRFGSLTATLEPCESPNW